MRRYIASGPEEEELMEKILLLAGENFCGSSGCQTFSANILMRWPTLVFLLGFPLVPVKNLFVTMCPALRRLLGYI